MAESNGSYDWRERMERIEDSIERNWAGRERINRNAERMDRNINRLHADLTKQKENIDNLLAGLRELIDRIPPENLKY